MQVDKWLSMAFTAVEKLEVSLAERRRLRWQALELSAKHWHADEATEDEHLKANHVEHFAEVLIAAGEGIAVSVTAAKSKLSLMGIAGKNLAGRVAKLSRVRNTAAHPDLALASDIRQLLDKQQLESEGKHQGEQDEDEGSTTTGEQDTDASSSTGKASGGETPGDNSMFDDAGVEVKTAPRVPGGEADPSGDKVADKELRAGGSAEKPQEKTFDDDGKGDQHTEELATADQDSKELQDTEHCELAWGRLSPSTREGITATVELVPWHLRAEIRAQLIADSLAAG